MVIRWCSFRLTYDWFNVHGIHCSSHCSPHCLRWNDWSMFVEPCKRRRKVASLRSYHRKWLKYYFPQLLSEYARGPCCLYFPQRFNDFFHVDSNKLSVEMAKCWCCSWLSSLRSISRWKTDFVIHLHSANTWQHSCRVNKANRRLFFSRNVFSY